MNFKKLKKKKLRLNKGKINNRHKKKYKGDYDLLKIPYKFDYYKMLEDLHKKSSHCSIKKLLNAFNNKGFTYHGLFTDCKIIIKSCNICAQKKRKFLKKESCQQIIFKKPFDRFIADITELPYELIKDTEYKYQLNIIDHFSKYGFSYILENKTAQKVFECIEDCFNKAGFPNEFGTDNGLNFAIIN